MSSLDASRAPEDQRHNQPSCVAPDDTFPSIVTLNFDVRGLTHMYRYEDPEKGSCSGVDRSATAT